MPGFVGPANGPCLHTDGPTLLAPASCLQYFEGAARRASHGEGIVRGGRGLHRQEWLGALQWTKWTGVCLCICYGRIGINHANMAGDYRCPNSKHMCSFEAQIRSSQAQGWDATAGISSHTCMMPHNKLRHCCWCLASHVHPSSNCLSLPGPWLEQQSHGRLPAASRQHIHQQLHAVYHQQLHASTSTHASSQTGTHPAHQQASKLYIIIKKRNTLSPAACSPSWARWTWHSWQLMRWACLWPAT